MRRQFTIWAQNYPIKAGCLRGVLVFALIGGCFVSYVIFGGPLRIQHRGKVSIVKDGMRRASDALKQFHDANGYWPPARDGKSYWAPFSEDLVFPFKVNDGSERSYLGPPLDPYRQKPYPGEVRLSGAFNGREGILCFPKSVDIRHSTIGRRTARW